MEDYKPFKKLAEAYKELDRFAYVASHDLKGPLRGMSNIIDWVREDIELKTFDSTSNHLDLLKSRVDRMETLLKDILSFSRAGKTVTKPEKVDMNHLIKNIIDWVSIPKGFEVSILNSLPVLTIQV